MSGHQSQGITGEDMADVRVRGVSDEIVLALKDQARRHGKTFGEELRGVLTEAALRPRREWADRLEVLRESIRKVHGELPDSTPMIREERDSWG